MGPEELDEDGAVVRTAVTMLRNRHQLGVEDARSRLALGCAATGELPCEVARRVVRGTFETHSPAVAPAAADVPAPFAVPWL